MKKFNTTGICLSEKHYMVNIDQKLQSIMELIHEGDYFMINRARQYGKTTTLHLLAQSLQDRYTVFSLSFEGMGEAAFNNEYTFCRNFCILMDRAVRFGKMTDVDSQVSEELRSLSRDEKVDFPKLTDWILALCHTSKRPVVLIIDEVDQASNYRVFLDFLGVLRNNYLQRNTMPAFQSVILAGVYDIKNLKLKIRPDGEHQYNSPWNIASDFRVDMSFNVDEISNMLDEYEDEHHVGMDVREISNLLYDYTSGYPYMVSRICKLMDEEFKVWTKQGFLEAVKLMLKEQNTLFDDMQKKLSDYPELKKIISNILFTGSSYSYEANNGILDIGIMFGFLKEDNNLICISNRIYETKLYNLLISEEETTSDIYKAGIMEKNQFIIDGRLSMKRVMEKFQQHYADLYSVTSDKFLEENGRRIFLTFLKPIINGTGNYYIESQTRDMKRTDVIVDYAGCQEIIELKIWRGEEYNHRGEKQLFEYLEFYHKSNGYLLSFNFNKHKKTGLKEIEYKGKRILEVIC